MGLPSPAPLFECLVARRSELVAMLTRMGFGEEDAEDAAQEAIIRGIEAIKTGAVERIRNRKAWLREVARNAAITMLRRNRAYLSIDSIEVPSTPSEDAQVEDHRNDSIAVVRKAIAQLPELTRPLVVFCYLESHTYREARDHFQVKLGTVNGRLTAARKRLRRILGRTLPDLLET